MFMKKSQRNICHADANDIYNIITVSIAVVPKLFSTIIIIINYES